MDPSKPDTISVMTDGERRDIAEVMFGGERLPPPTSKEFILRCVQPRAATPIPTALPIPHRMHVSITSEEFTVATSVGESM